MSQRIIVERGDEHIVVARAADGSIAILRDGRPDALLEPPAPFALPEFTVAPAITGLANIGQTLTATATVTGGKIIGYQWLRDGAAISGATGTTYVLVMADVGAQISVRITAVGIAEGASATSSALGPVSGIPAVTPSSAWNGSAGSGFGGEFPVAPSDPARSTAKPILRLITPDYQRFTDTLDVLIVAAAKNGNTVLPDLGISAISAQFEGSNVALGNARFHTHVDANGIARVYYGWAVQLKKPAGFEGEGDADLYVTATAIDGTMQQRVIGPFRFFPVDQLYTHQVEVAATPAEIAGERYKTLQAACAYLTNLGTSTTRPAAPLITITEGGFYEGVIVTGLGFPLNAKGRIYLQADEPVTIGFSSYVSDGNEQKFDTRLPIHVLGSNVSFDMKNILVFEHEGGTGSGSSGSVFDGCRFINSDGREAYWRSGTRPITGFTSTQSAWYLECEVVDCHAPFINARAVRGGTATGGCGDVCTNAQAVVNHVTDDWDSLAEWAVMVPAIDILGPAGSTMSLSGNSDASSRTITLREGGSSVGTFIVGNTFALWQAANDPGYDATTAGQGYYVQDVADWINSLSGWSATVLDNRRRASAFALTGTKGGPFTNISTATTLRLNTFFDFHDDWYQTNNSGPANVFLFGNRGTRMSNQFLIHNGTAGTTDLFCVNNAFMNLLDGESAVRLSQFARAHSHVVFAHNSLPGQGFRFDLASGYNPDQYCLFTNNAVKSIAWSAGTPDGDLRIADNAIDAGFTAPSGAIDTIIGGDYTTKFVDAVGGDFTPAGPLIENLRPRVVIPDANGDERAASDAVGALAVAA